MHSASRIGSWTGSPSYLLLSRALLIVPPHCSALGVYDGNVYETLVERAKDEPLNASEVTPAYEVGYLSSSAAVP